MLSHACLSALTRRFGQNTELLEISEALNKIDYEPWITRVDGASYNHRASRLIQLILEFNKEITLESLKEVLGAISNNALVSTQIKAVVHFDFLRHIHRSNLSPHETLASLHEIKLFIDTHKMELSEPLLVKMEHAYKLQERITQEK